MTMRLVFCVSGSGHLFKAAVRHRERLEIEPALLIVRPKASADLEAFCEEHGVAIVRLPVMPRPQFDQTLASLCHDAAPDLISLTFDRLLTEEFVQTYARRIINVHPSLLPAFVGIDPVQAALASSVRLSGCTIHEVVHELDAGPIIAQCVTQIIPGDTRESWGNRMYRLLEPMYLQVLSWYREGRIEHAADGRITVRGADYDSLPISPKLERFSVA
jgi:phosphoribosylglycinamide formyltransferase 1